MYSIWSLLHFLSLLRIPVTAGIDSPLDDEEDELQKVDEVYRHTHQTHFLQDVHQYVDQVDRGQAGDEAEEDGKEQDSPGGRQTCKDIRYEVSGEQYGAEVTPCMCSNIESVYSLAKQTV